MCDLEWLHIMSPMQEMLLKLFPFLSDNGKHECYDRSNYNHIIGIKYDHFKTGINI